VERVENGAHADLNNSRTAGAIIIRLSHGYQVKETADPIVAIVDRATNQFSAASQPGAWLVDVLPIRTSEYNNEVCSTG
jgi:hypothetical protein